MTERTDAIDEAVGDAEALALEPRTFYDAFVIGVGERGGDTFLVYDKAAMIEAMARENDESGDYADDDPRSAAIEHYDFNMNQGGDGMPVYVTLLDE